MKRLALLFSLVTILVSFTSCVKSFDVDNALDSVFNVETRQEEVLNSIGHCDSNKMWTHGGVQDYTDYGIYSYSSSNLNNNQYFNPITQSDVETINSFIDNFEGWVNTFKENDPNDKLVLNYTFDRSIIDAADYFYIYEDEDYPEFGCYDLYIFDTQTNVLYYFHNNI